jgi:hemoglobin/transferrin/lactoferrin receptor protein
VKFFYILFYLQFIFVPLQAQEEDTTKVSYLDEVVVSVNRWEQNLKEISNRVAKVNRLTIALQNPQTSADLLALSGQVFIQKSQLGGGSPMIRGFATNRVLMVVDGVRMNNAIFRSGNLQNVISLDANAMQETEVIFGPGSVIYGSDAIGGVMDFHTLQPNFSTDKTKINGHAFVRASSANKEKTSHVDFNIALKKWAFTSSFTNGSYNDLRMGSRGPLEYTRSDYQLRDVNGTDITVSNPDPNVQVASGYDQLNVMQTVRFMPQANWDFTYGFHFSSTSDVPRYDRLILKNNSNVFSSAEWYYGPQKWMMHALNARFTKSTLLFDQAKFTGGYQHYEESRHNRNFSGGNRNVRTDRYEQVKAFSFNLDFDKQLTDKAGIFYGAEFVTNKVGSTAERVNITNGTVAGTSTRYPDGSEWKSYAAYASLRYTLSKKWLLNASTRYTFIYTYAPFDLTFFDFPFTEATLRNGAMNGSIGLVFAPVADWKLYSSFSTGFRSPNVDDLGKVFDSQPGFVVVPNPTLKPEHAYSAEIGFAGKVAKDFTIDASVFYTLLDNAIARGGFTFNGQPQIDYEGTPSNVLALQNISELTVRGFQVGLNWKILKTVHLSSSINLQKGKEKDTSTDQYFSPTHVAPSFGSTQVTYKNKKIHLALYANYNGEISYDNLALSERADRHLYAKDENGNPYSPSWATLNLKGSYSLFKHITVDAGIENMCDKRYRPYSSGITASGRNIFGTIRVRF